MEAGLAELDLGGVRGMERVKVEGVRVERGRVAEAVLLAGWVVEQVLVAIVAAGEVTDTRVGWG